MSVNAFHIAFASNDAYVPYLAVTLQSLLSHQPEVEGRQWIVHILTDGMSEGSVQSLEEIVSKRADFRLEVHVVSTQSFSELPDLGYSIYTYLRFLLPTVLPAVDKVLYLDVDLLVADDISKLFLAPIDTAIAAVPEFWNQKHRKKWQLSAETFYFNAGVLLINLSIWREKDYAKSLITWCGEHQKRLRFPDQDALNVVLQDDVSWLPLRYNVMYNDMERTDYYENARFQTEIGDCLYRPAIIHFAGCAPWFDDKRKHPYHYLWWEQNAQMKSPQSPRASLKGWKRRKFFFKQIFYKLISRYPSLEQLQEKYQQVLKKSQSKSQ